MNDAFVSIVENYEDTATLVVRARDEQSLLNLFPDLAPRFSDTTDYAWRVTVPRPRVAELMASRIAGIDYRNFKDSASKVDKQRGHMYSNMWMAHFDYQIELLHGANRRWGRPVDHGSEPQPEVRDDAYFRDLFHSHGYGTDRGPPVVETRKGRRKRRRGNKQ